VAKPGARFKIILSPSAKADVRDVLDWSLEKFGVQTARRYRVLLKQAFIDIGDNPERPGSQQRAELAPGALVYHLRFSRDRAKSGLGIVRNPKHFVIYRRREGSKNVIDVARILHDARDLQRHLPEGYRRTDAEGV
jgi:toxin ParE1/3/4